MNPYRFFTVFAALCWLFAGETSCSAKEAKSEIDFVNVTFPATRENKAVSLAVYRGADAVLREKFATAQHIFEQGILELNLAKQPTAVTKEFFLRQAAWWTALSSEASVASECRAAALHNAANCHTVNRDYGKAFELASSAAALNPKQSRYATECAALRDGFYAKRKGYESVKIRAPVLRQTEQTAARTGVVAAIELSSPTLVVTPYRTVKKALGAIWINELKRYSVAYKETAELGSRPIMGVLTLQNHTERVVDCRGVVVQVSVNGNPVGATSALEWKSDPVHVVPNGKAVAVFAVVNPRTLPAEGTVSIAVFDLPAKVSAAGAIEDKRNDAFSWKIERGDYFIDLINRSTEEKITQQDALTEGRAIAQEPHFERLGEPPE